MTKQIDTSKKAKKLVDETIDLDTKYWDKIDEIFLRNFGLTKEQFEEMKSFPTAEERNAYYWNNRKE